MNSRIESVIEIYTDVTDTLASIEHRQFIVAGVVLAILGLFYIVLYVFISNAERILQHQRREYRLATGLSSRLGRLLVNREKITPQNPLTREHVKTLDITWRICTGCIPGISSLYIRARSFWST